MSKAPAGPQASRYDQQMRVTDGAGEGIRWIEPFESPLELSGFPWFEQDRLYRRMPATPAQALPEAVDGLANHTAGGQIRLRTDSTRVAVRVELAGPAGMNHMPATGQCGFDLYVGAGGGTFAGIAKYDHTQTQYEVLLFRQSERTLRDVTLNFPLYQGVRSVQLGVDEEALVEAPAPRPAAPLVFYGTSITQGGCAARPGMAYPAILSRRLGRECVNVGFSGSGKGEAEVAHAIATIPASELFVLDYDANCPSAQHLSETMPLFIDILRASHPTTPILAVSRIRIGGEGWNPAITANRRERGAAQRQVVEQKRADGVEGLHFLDGETLLGGDDFPECTVDGSHPTDLGFQRMADGLEPVLRGILGQ